MQKKWIGRPKSEKYIQNTPLLNLIMIRASMPFVSVCHELEFHWTLNMILIFWNLRIEQNSTFMNLSLKWAWMSLINVNDQYFQKIWQNRIFEQKKLLPVVMRSITVRTKMSFISVCCYQKLHWFLNMILIFWNLGEELNSILNS